MPTGSEHLKDEGTRLQAVTAGAISGLVARFVIAPLDVIKIRLQLQTHSVASGPTEAGLAASPVYYRGALSAARHIVATEGVTALWKGNVPAELMYVLYSGAQFTTYRSVTLMLQRLGGEGWDPSRGGRGETRLSHAAQAFVAGAAAGAAATGVTYPLDLLRTRFAAQGGRGLGLGAFRRGARTVADASAEVTTYYYASLRQAVAAIYRDEGPRGYFRGLSAGVMQVVPYMGTFFVLYEALRQLPILRGTDAGGWLPLSTGDAAAGAIASAVAKTAVFPLDLVRKRLQVQGPSRAGGGYVHKNIPEYTGGVWSTVEAIVKAEGVRGLYRGLTISLLKTAPGSAVTLWTYERVLGAMLKMDEAKAEREQGLR